MALLCLEFGACSGGGGGGGRATFPVPPWARFRRDGAGSGAGLGAVKENPGTFRFAPFDLKPFGGVTRSSPAIGLEGTIYVGTGNGVVAISAGGQLIWHFERCGETPVGGVSSSPAVTGDNDVVVTTDTGYVFHVQDEGETFVCRWAVRPGNGAPLRSSPLLLTDARDDDLSEVYIGTSSGELLSLNGDGIERWRFSPVPSGRPATASPVIGSDGTIYFLSPDGVLHAVDRAGESRWQFRVGLPAAASDFLPSPAVDTVAGSSFTGSIYAIGDAEITAVYPDGRDFKWRHDFDAEVVGSPAFALQLVEDRAAPTPGGSPTPTPSGTPTPVMITEVVVYAVDVNGTLYGIRDADGSLEAEPIQPQPTPGRVITSPAVSTDFFVVFGSADGKIYALNLRGEEPTEGDRWPVALPTMTPPSPESVGRSPATLSDPVIGDDGTIYVTAEDGFLYAIGSLGTPTPSPRSRATATPTPSAAPGTSTATPVP